MPDGFESDYETESESGHDDDNDSVSSEDSAIASDSSESHISSTSSSEYPLEIRSVTGLADFLVRNFWHYPEVLTESLEIVRGKVRESRFHKTVTSSTEDPTAIVE